jgi:hypothetical protein
MLDLDEFTDEWVDLFYWYGVPDILPERNRKQ